VVHELPSISALRSAVASSLAAHARKVHVAEAPLK
jgi:hypothetical protein